MRTAFEVRMEDHLRLCSQRQPYIDQGQSINLYFTSNDSEEYISEIHKMAFEDENILSLYYIYSMRGAGNITRVEVCEVCT
jgi:ribonucleoside-diphosphate reductase alpha chain